jgi:hypothetical protein
MKMKGLVFDLAIGLALVTGMTSAGSAQRSIDERVPASPSGYIRIHNMGGSVRVTAWDRDTIAVTGSVWETKSDRFEIHSGEGGAKLGLWNDTGGPVRPSTFEVRVPRGSHVWVKTGSADIAIEGVRGGVDLYSVTGRITLTGDPREVFAESMGGGIDITANTRSVRATSASGDIAVRGAIADASVRTVSGDLLIEGIQFERGRFESVEGDIRYTGEIGRSSLLDFVNHSGAVEFILPPKVAADFVVSTFEGGLDDRYGVRAESRQSKLKGTELTFTIGGGGGHVTVRNFKGRVVLRRK